MRTGNEIGRPQGDRSRPDRWRVGLPVGLAVALGGLFTIVIIAVDDLRFVYEGAQLRSALDTAQCLIGALVAYLLYGRFRRTGLLNDLALSFALGLSAATNLFFAAGPAVVRDLEPNAFTTWAPLMARTLSAAIVAWAALAPDRPYHLAARPARLLASSLVAVLGLIALTFWLLGDTLPIGVQRSLTTSGSRRPHLESEPVLLVAQLVIMGCFAAASVGFARRAVVDRSPFTLALAVACVLNAFARLNYFLYPSLYTNIVHTGDVLRLGYFLVLLVGAASEIRRYWLAQTQAAAAAERRRIARDLHDGLMQDLSFIRSHTASLAAGRGDVRILGDVRDAADRALSHSRRVVRSLRQTDPRSLREVLHDAVDGTGGGSDSAVTLDVDDTQVAPELASAVATIVREAVDNARRHGRANRIDVRATTSRGWIQLAVTDDGDGFSVGATEAVGGAGVEGMREQADLVGGQLVITSASGQGTTVEARLPASPR